MTVDGRPRPKNHRMSPGESVTVEEGADDQQRPPAEAPPLPIVHEDDHLLVVDKPAGVVVHPARGHATGTLK